MRSVDRQVLETASAWISQGRNVLLFTVVRTWGSASRPIGSMMALRDDGQVVGSVPGRCIEDNLIDSVRRVGMPDELPSVVEYGVKADEAHRFGLPSGGTLRLVRETLGNHSKLDSLIEALMSPVYYVGAIGSRRNSDERRSRLRLFGVTENKLDALHAPVGVHLGGATPPEIAISILAELTACRNGVSVHKLMKVSAGKAVSNACLVPT
ncbi:XdhC family protein [Caballeronia sp. 15711]|uniref:XdhC family protein n=1 Tax=Caballeronia sp. 15711 TaxID=3391029 RepID=UPI0039E4559C